MSIYILTSMFPDGLPAEASKVFQQTITRRTMFAFVASDFEQPYEKTDYYFKVFLDMLADSGILFENACVVDGRSTPAEAQRAVEEADVVWLSGGDTPLQFHYLQNYGLDRVIGHHQGIVIGMSAGAINMAKTSICTLSCGHYKQEIYRGLGCVNISVEPHFNPARVSDELLELSKEYLIYGLCDDSIIVCRDKNAAFYGEIYEIKDGKVQRIKEKQRECI